MASKGINKVILVGRIGQDPEINYSAGGNAITKISIATSETWQDKTTRQTQERTEWHNVTFFGKLAEIAGEYLRKGSQVYIEGKLKTDKYQDKATGQDRYSTGIVVDSFTGVLQMLGDRQENPQAKQQPQKQQAQQQPQKQQQAIQPQQQDNDYDDDGIPF